MFLAIICVICIFGAFILGFWHQYQPAPYRGSLAWILLLIAVSIMAYRMFEGQIKS